MDRRNCTAKALLMACIVLAVSSVADAGPIHFVKSLAGQRSATVALPLKLGKISMSKCPAPAKHTPEAQAAALLSGVTSIKYVKGSNISSWHPHESPCKWEGITCENGLVKQIDVEAFELIGQLPVAWTAIDTLKALDVHNNKFEGAISDCFCNLANLRELELNENKFSGTPPACLGKLEKLEELEMQDNQFSGPIPSQWSTMKSLKALSFFNNKELSGCVPAVFEKQGTEFGVASDDSKFSKDAASKDVTAGTGVTGFC